MSRKARIVQDGTWKFIIPSVRFTDLQDKVSKFLVLKFLPAALAHYGKETISVSQFGSFLSGLIVQSYPNGTRRSSCVVRIGKRDYSLCDAFRSLGVMETYSDRNVPDRSGEIIHSCRGGMEMSALRLRIGKYVDLKAENAQSAHYTDEGNALSLETVEVLEAHGDQSD